jgi:hypothetical protein
VKENLVPILEGSRIIRYHHCPKASIVLVEILTIFDVINTGGKINVKDLNK